MNVLSSIDAIDLPVTELDRDEFWYKDAVIYQLHVKAFADSNNDGIGDFAGLCDKLDYLQDLGVTALWLLPFYPSPGRDDGYDIADYGAINPDFGTMKDFKRFIQEARKRGLRVITELVVNHTSDEHDWFKRARRSPPGSSARNWYVWSDSDQKYPGTRIIFTDTEKSNWTWDPEAGQFYWHRFFSHQPDLNFDNPRVVSALIQVMKRWLDAAWTASGSTRFPICVSATAPTTRTCRRRMRSSASCAPSSTPIPRASCCWRKPINGRRMCRNISATATNATWLTTSR
jgi:maltose alpha-D-glucosyltransferase/alpha-amylase